jgi:phage-related protein
LPYEAQAREVDQFQVGFKVNPFFFLDSGSEYITLSAPATIYNPGTIYAEPYIKITGSGDIDLTINDTVYAFTGVDGYIEINSELKTVYKDTINQGNKMIGEFPVLSIGDNMISWSGAVTSVEIMPKWREL